MKYRQSNSNRGYFAQPKIKITHVKNNFMIFMNYVGLNLSLSEDRLDLRSSNFFFVCSSEILFSVNSVFWIKGTEDNSSINVSTSKGFFK